MSINANNDMLNDILETINELPSSKEEQLKTVDITENGTTVVTPDEGMALSGVTVNVIVESSDSESPTNAKFRVVKYTDEGYPLEINYCADGDITSPKYGFGNNGNYISQFWSKIEKINFPSTVVAIDDYGLIGLNSLKEVTNWDDIESIGVSGFCDCDLKYDYLPPKLTKISKQAFMYVDMPITELPSGITTIEENAFGYCSYNMNIKTLPPNLISIGSYAFRNNGFATVSFSEIPASVQTIGSYAFRGSSKGIVGSLIFKGTPTSIAANAFDMGTNVTDIYVPWSEGAVENAPWGMTNATIHYNTTYDESGNPIITEE